MKKTITLLTATLLFFTASFAQHNERRDDDDHNKDHDMVLNNNRDRGNYNNRNTYLLARERDSKIEVINRRYFRQVESVEHRFFLGRSRKQQLIYSFAQQRNDALRSVYANYNRNHFDYKNDNRGDDNRRKNF